MTVLSKFLGAALCLTVSLSSATSEERQNGKQLLGHPVPYKLVEEKIKDTLSKQCPPGSNPPYIPDIKWEYHNEIRTVTSPFSHIPKKTSSKLMEWKRHLNEIAYGNGYSEHDPYINTRRLDAPNVFDHFRYNGASACRDIDLVIPEYDYFGQVSNRVYPMTDVIEVVRVSKHHRIPFLDGQFALRAKMNIPKDTVLGRFCGDEMYRFEYNTVYKGTCEKQMRDNYRMTLPCPGNEFHGNESCPFQGKDAAIIVDEVTTFPANPLVIANDPRKDLSKSGLTAEDNLYRNALFRNINVNGWPYLVVVNDKPIRKGDEITIYYGKNYVLRPEQMKRH